MNEAFPVFINITPQNLTRKQCLFLLGKYGTFGMAEKHENPVP